MLETMSIKRLLTLDDLVKFCKEQKFTKFNSKETGYKLAVQVPAQFEINKEQEDDSLLFCKVKLMHSGENRNHSSVTNDALKKASKTLAYKPILANFMEYTDAETDETLKDFTSHDMILNDDGTITYLEKQIGSFTADKPFFEVEEETGHNFLYGYCAIPREYTDAASIIERKKGTKVSVELEINEMQYSAEKKLLELTDVNIMGATCLGKDPETLEDIGEGMLNARLDIADFSVENNSIKFNKDDKIIELLERLDNTLSNFTIDKNTFGKEEKIEVDEKEIFDEVAETEVEETVTETEETTEEEVTVTENESEETVDETPEESDSSVEDTDDVTETNENVTDYSLTVKFADKEFAISLQEKIYALYDLVNAQYAEADNTWYSVTAYDDYVIMCDWWSGKYFKQTYSEEDNVFTLTGDRVPVFAEFVTEEELNSLNAMRSNYASLVEFKENVEKKELHAKREEVLNSEKYSAIKDVEAFKELVSNMDNYSLEDLEKEAKVIFADNFDASKFSFKENKNDVMLFTNVKKEKKESRYGDLFSK